MVEDATVLGGLASTKIPTNQKLRNSTSGVNIMNSLAPHECKPSFNDTMLICYKCFLTAVLLYDSGSEGGLTTLTGRSYIGNTSADKTDDQDNVRMFGLTMPKILRDFERQSQSFVSRYQELVDRVIGGKRRTTLNTTANITTRK